jgi:hypothetical protein
MWQESEEESHTRVIEDSFIFPTVIYTNQYHKWSKSYEFLTISQAAVSLCRQTGNTWENCIFDHQDFIISENLQYQTRSELSQLSSHYSYAQIWQPEKKLWSLEYSAQVEEPWI